MFVRLGKFFILELGAVGFGGGRKVGFCLLEFKCFRVNFDELFFERKIFFFRFYVVFRYRRL